MPPREDRVHCLQPDVLCDSVVRYGFAEVRKSFAPTRAARIAGLDVRQLRSYIQS